MDKFLKIINLICFISPILIYYILRLDVSPVFFIYILIPLIYCQVKKGINFAIKIFSCFLLTIFITLIVFHFSMLIDTNNFLLLLFDILNLTVVAGLITFLIDNLTKENEYLTQAIMEDPLTNIFNKRYFTLKLNHEFNNHIKNNNQLCLLIADLDHFKHCNDNCGHLIGDLILKDFSKILCNSIRKSDIAARYGGEEFSVILPKTNIIEAIAIAERIRFDIENYEFDVSAIDGPCNKCKKTVSIGIACLDSNCKNPNQLIDRADEALYQAKINRNEVHIWYDKRGE